MVMAFVVGLYASLTVPEIKEAVEAPPVFTTGLVEADVRVDGTTITLANGCQALVFDVTRDQAFSISHGIAGTFSVRPLTHDILKDIMEQYGVEVLQIRIDRFEDEIYKARITLFGNGKMVELDARPSDSIALASRLGIPVYLDKEMLDRSGTDICQ